MNEYTEGKEELLSFIPEQCPFETDVIEIISQLQNTVEDLKKRVEILEAIVNPTVANDPQCQCPGNIFRKLFGVFRSS